MQAVTDGNLRRGRVAVEDNSFFGAAAGTVGRDQVERRFAFNTAQIRQVGKRSGAVVRSEQGNRCAVYRQTGRTGCGRYGTGDIPGIAAGVAVG